MKFVETLVFDVQEEVVAEQIFDEGVFERLAGRVGAGESADVVLVEEIGCEGGDYVLGGGRSRDRIGDIRASVRLVPDFESLRPTRLGPWRW